MRERLPVIVGRIVLSVVVLAGSIVTFNFGLNEGLNPSEYANSDSDTGFVFSITNDGKLIFERPSNSGYAKNFAAGRMPEATFILAGILLVIGFVGWLTMRRRTTKS